ncbi:unnamed protein product [Adineta steineri]|uniref:Kinase n=1 Tax=Adineta steineri TaxID=433720 RepID=A0A819BFM2_9BILA|nr:unnamed protein product [Adineta steineri]CAF3797427.1 unnamed protein product [Adineta steineri]
MYSSDDNNSNSVRNALFDAAVQLSVPTVTSTASAATKMRVNSATDGITSTSRARSPPNSLRFSLSSGVNSTRQQSAFKNPKTLRDVATQSSPIPTKHDQLHISPENSKLILDNNNNPTTSSISETSKEYLSVPVHSNQRRSPSSSPTRSNKSLKNTLLGLWQGLNNDELRSAASSPMDPKYFEERVRISTPRWKAFSKVVTSVLTFTRTKKGRYEWIQLVGHPGTFKEGFHDGYVLKELCKHERYCCEVLQNDILKTFVPKYNGTVTDDEGKSYIEMEDLLATFHEPCIMDCKIGVRTYLEEDLAKSESDPVPRADLYEKMIAIDPTAPTEKENEEKKILKPRYMIWRETLSSSQELGFRIEGIKKSRGLMSKDFQRIKDRNDVRQQLTDFIANSLPRATRYQKRLIDLRSTCLRSKFFQTHELIGSSLLFVHDNTRASLWMIDFGKTRKLPNDFQITHSKPWIRGTHEDGYLIGLDNLIMILQDIIDELKSSLVSN